MYKYFLVARNLNKFYVKPQKEAGQYYISLKSKTKEFVKYNSRNRKKHFPNDKKIKKKKNRKKISTERVKRDSLKKQTEHYIS